MRLCRTLSMWICACLPRLLVVLRHLWRSFVVLCLTSASFVAFTPAHSSASRGMRRSASSWPRRATLGPRSEVGRLMAFHSPFSSTYKVILCKSRMIHNINVPFDDSNCTEQHALPSASPQPRQLLDVRIEQAPSAATEEVRGMGVSQYHSPHSQSPSQYSTS